MRVYKGAGVGEEGKKCTLCAGVGYFGRTAIFEVLEINEELRSIITHKASSDEIRKKAIELGMTTLIDDGISRVLQGETTLDEIARVTKI